MNDSTASKTQAAKPGPGSLLAEDDVAQALDRLEKNYATIIDRTKLASHMAAGPDDVNAYLNKLLEQGQVLAIGTAMSTLMDLMTTVPARSFLTSRIVAKLLLAIFAASSRVAQARAVGASVQRTHDRWSATAPEEAAATDTATKLALRTTRSIATLPDEFPPILVAAIARAAQRGDAAAARPDFATWLEENTEQAAELRRIMARSAPSLLNPIIDLFPTAEEVRPTGLMARLGLPKWAIAAMVAAALVVAGVSGLLSGKSALEEASDGVCQYAGSGHQACVWSIIIADASEDADCDVITPAIIKFLNAVDSMAKAGGGPSGTVDLAALNTAKARADRLLVTAQKLCPLP